MLKDLIDMVCILLGNSRFHAIITVATWSVIVAGLTLITREVISLWKSIGEKVTATDLRDLSRSIEARLIRLENKFFRRAMTDEEAAKYYEVKNGRIQNKK